jgi:hypothetical protein
LGERGGVLARDEDFTIIKMHPAELSGTMVLVKDIINQKGTGC